MKRAVALACCAVLLACRRSPAPVAAAPPPSDPKVVADWSGGSATLTDVEECAFR